MSRLLPIAAVQAAPHSVDAPLEPFAESVVALLESHPQTRLVVHPELHLYGADGPAADTDARLDAAAEPIDGPRCRSLAELAGDLGVWLVPGSICERGPQGQLYNTAVVFSPQGRLVASYRKVFPW